MNIPSSTDLSTSEPLCRTWQVQLAEANNPARLARSLGWPDELADQFEADDAGFAARATRYYLGLVDPSDPKDPVLAQVLQSGREVLPAPPGFEDDAVGDRLPGNAVAPGLIHKYEGRALLVLSGACAVNCRFCFRRNYPYAEVREGGARMAAALAALRRSPEVREVILSGGDPLSLPTSYISDLLDSLGELPGLRRVRIHTRMPVVLPDRIDKDFLAMLARFPTGTLWMVTHFNCPEELAPPALAALRRIVGSGVPVLNQSVLLRGVNDDTERLAELCEGLVDVGVKPYYLHQLDRVRGASHWEVPVERGLSLMTELRGRVSGLAMPSYVADRPGDPAKRPLTLRSL